jgi:hypothetical protein
MNLIRNSLKIIGKINYLDASIRGINRKPIILRYKYRGIKPTGGIKKSSVSWCLCGLFYWRPWRGTGGGNEKDNVLLVGNDGFEGGPRGVAKWRGSDRKRGEGDGFLVRPYIVQFR